MPPRSIPQLFEPLVAERERAARVAGQNEAAALALKALKLAYDRGYEHGAQAGAQAAVDAMARRAAKP